MIGYEVVLSFANWRDINGLIWSLTVDLNV